MKINRPVVAPVLQPKKTLKNRINNLKNNIRDKVLGLKQVSQKDSPEGELTKGKNPVQTKLVEIGSKLQDTYDRLAMTGDLQVIDPNCCDDETMDGFIDDFISLDTGDRPEPMDKYKDPLGKRIITALENGIKVVESVVDDKL